MIRGAIAMGQRLGFMPVMASDDRNNAHGALGYNEETGHWEPATIPFTTPSTSCSAVLPSLC
jgi:hypothetical protein